MKFLHFALDRGQLVSGKEVSTLNERELAAGRSLRRPQNTHIPTARATIGAPNSNSTSADSSAVSPLQQFDALPFDAFLSTEYRMSKKLAGMIRHALCYIDTPTTSGTSASSLSAAESVSTGHALDLLYTNINCIGKFGETPFITCMYGASELPQAFCRYVYLCIYLYSVTSRCIEV